MRDMPSAIHAEEALLGALMNDNTRLADCGDLSAASFFVESNAVVFAAMQDADRAGRKFDCVTLFEAFHQAGRHGDGFSLTTLAAMQRNSPSSANVQAYSAAILDKHERRKLIEAGHALIAGATSAQTTDEAKADADRILSRDRAPRTLRSIKPVIMSALSELEERAKHGGIVGTKTPWPEITNRMGGMRPGDLIVAAARPGMGKTAFALNMSSYAARQGSVLIVSAEMTAEQLVERKLSANNGPDYKSIRAANFEGEEWDSLQASMIDLKDLPIFIDDSPTLTVQQIRQRAKVVAAKKDLSLIVIDYAQLMTGEGRNRTEEVGSISRGLKRIAKELRCPVLMLSQLNRDVERRDNKRPLPADLRDSGEIEQDADAIIMLYRDSVYYGENSRYGNIAEAIFTKLRAGEIGTVPLKWDGAHMKFLSCSEDEYKSAKDAAEAVPAKPKQSGGFGGVKDA